MRVWMWAFLIGAAGPAIASAQSNGIPGETPPTGLARVEVERSRQCVDVLARMAKLEADLEPLAARSQRLIAIAEAIAIEDRAAVEPFDTTDTAEARVAEWFERDLALAQRYLDEQDEALMEERAAAREAIKELVSSVLAELQAEANGRIAAAGRLTTSVGGCEGAILIRPAVLEVCDTTSGPVCDAARDSTAASGQYRFVDAVENLWEVEEIRPWTSPTALTTGPNGQIGGARTLAHARNGNLTVTIAFAPLLGQKSEYAPEELERFDTIRDSLNFQFDHPEIAFVPALSLRASVPEPLAGETSYVLHFEDTGNADVIWTGPAGTGQAVESITPMAPRHIMRLASGHPVRFTAVTDDEEGAGGEVVYSIQFTPLNQSGAVSALVSYMARQLGQDVRRLVPPGGARR